MVRPYAGGACDPQPYQNALYLPEFRMKRLGASPSPPGEEDLSAPIARQQSDLPRWLAASKRAGNHLQGILDSMRYAP
jgi:hypothetical protein